MIPLEWGRIISIVLRTRLMPSDAPAQETSSSGRTAAGADEPDRTSFEPGTPPRITLGPVILLLVGAALDLLSMVVPKLGTPRDLIEQVTVLAAVFFLSGSALWVIRQLGNIPRATRLVMAAACLVITSQTLTLCEQIPLLDGTFVLGSGGILHELIENASYPVGLILLLAGFFSSALETQQARYRLALQHEEVRKEFAQRKRAEDALVGTERRYRFLAENVTDLICTMDLDLRFTYVSPSITTLLGYPVEQMMGTPLYRIMAPPSFDVVKKVLAEELLRDEEDDSDPFRSRTVEIELTTRSGASVSTEAKARFLRAPDGRISEILAVVRDITARKKMEDGLRKSRDELQERVKERTLELERANEELLAEVAEHKRTLDALRQSEGKYRLLVENTPAVPWTSDQERNTVFISPHVEKVYGYSPQEIYEAGSHLWFGRIHPDDVERVKEAFQLLLTRNEMFDMEYRIQRKDGKWIWLHDTALTVYREGSMSYAYGVFIDVTERKQAAEALRESEERYRTLVETSPDAITLADLNGTIIVTNERGAHLMGFENVQELRTSGKTVFDFMAPEDRERALENARKTLETGNVRNIEYQVLRKDGTSFPAEISASLVRDAGGKPTAFIGVMRDITDRKRARDALRESEREFRLIADSVPSLFSYLGADGRYRFVNKYYEEWFGLTRVEIVGKHYREVVGDDAYEIIKDHVETALSGQRVSYEAALPYAHGGMRWVIADYVPFKDDGGQLKGFFALVTDITERKLVEEQIRLALKEKEVLLKEIQHRVKNNLQVISSLFDLQSRYTDDERVLAMFKESRDRVRSIALIHEKLYEADDLTRIDFGDYIKGLATHLFRSYGIGFDAVKLTTRFDDVPLSIDAAIPCALIVNELVSNSLKHAFRTDDECEIRLELRSDNDSQVTLVVADNGVGLPDGFTIDQPPSLGLRLVTTLTRQLKGSITVQREKGTTFSVTFPAT
jgi:PAS domain S-box-containing protein